VRQANVPRIPIDVTCTSPVLANLNSKLCCISHFINMQATRSHCTGFEVVSQTPKLSLPHNDSIECASKRKQQTGTVCANNADTWGGERSINVLGNSWFICAG